MPYVDVVVASSLFRQSWFGDSEMPGEQVLAELGVDSVVTTHGANGARWLSARGAVEVAGVQVKAVDTNGAGDVFCGAMLVGLSSGWSRDKTLTFANAQAARSCEHYGNRAWLDGLDQLSGQERSIGTAATDHR